MALAGPQAAEQWATAAPRTYLAAIFEVGRLCGSVGIEVPLTEAGGDISQLQALVQRMKQQVS